MIPDKLWGKVPFDHLPAYMQGILTLDTEPDMWPLLKGERVRCPVCKKATTWPYGKSFICSGCGYSPGKGIIEAPKQPERQEPKTKMMVKVKRTVRIVKCVRCGKEFDALSLNRRYCDECKKIIRREYYNEYQRNVRRARKCRA